MTLKIEQVALGDLKIYHNNPRKGNIDLIAESLEAYGQYKPITANKRTGEILAGNHTYQAAQALGWDKIAVAWVDVDEGTAAKIVAIDNRSSDLGEYDNEALAALLEALPDTAATGYEQSDIDDLKALLEEASAPSVGTFATLGVGESGQSGTGHIPTLDEYAERYNQKATRMLIADYANDTYIWLLDKLADYRKLNDIANNADAILHLVETQYGEKAPK
jgi:hypothetical protein